MPATDSGHSQRVIIDLADQPFAAIERSDEATLRQLFVNGFVQQHVLHANGRDGGSIALRVCIVIKVGANALISRIDEYFDPAELAPLLS